ncbi:MAG TPA: hypothetical protein VFI47_23715, partial [Acidimicrobiales bacterium]|nr:hypothetical protein [Acidimicrobiales bacterium]
MGDKLRGDQAEAKAALSRQGRYRPVAGNIEVKEVVIGDGVMRDRFVICRNPDEARRDTLVRDRLVAQLEEAITGTDKLPADERAGLATALPAGLHRFLRATPTGLLRVDRAKVRAEANLDVGVVVERVEGLVPRRQHRPRVRVDVARSLVGPPRQAVHVDRLVMGRPPHLVIGRGPDLADDLAGDGPSDRGVQVRGQAALGFDGGEVLDPVARAAAQVLPEPVHQLGEVQRIQRGAPVVVGPGVDRHTLAGDPAVAGEGEGDEHRGPVGLAIRRGEHPPDRAIRHRQPRQIRHVLPPPRRAHPPLRLVDALALVVGLVVVGRVFGFGVEVPALTALLDPQPFRPLRTRRAPVLPGRPARDGDDAHLTRLDVG